MIIIAVTQSIFKLGTPDFAWKQIQIISNIYDDDDDEDDDDDDDDKDDKDAYICKSVNFKVFLFRHLRSCPSVSNSVSILGIGL